jgi:hypothetical protein
MGRRGMYIGYSWKSQKERDHQEPKDFKSGIILKWVLHTVGGMDWIDLAQDRDRYGALVNTLINQK